MSTTTDRNTSRARRGSPPRGQVLVIFAFMLTILIGMAAFVVDMAWIWSHQLQVQRAADAGALAGVVHLPQQPGEATLSARDESQKNGYEHGVDGVDVNARQDASFGRRMVVTVSSPVDTFFMRLFGIDQVTVSRTSRAEYILPVPMGSPQNYYGVGRLVDATEAPAATSWRTPGDRSNPSDWTDDSAGRVNSSDNSYTTKNTTTDPFAAWREFNLSIPNGAPITGIEVEVEVRATSSGCRLGIELSSNANASNPTWTTSGEFVTPPSGSSSSDDDFLTAGGATDLWGRAWTEGQLESDNFGIRVQYIDPSSGCTSGSTIRLDRLRVRVHFTDVSIGEVDVLDPYGSTVLNPQNFWGGMQSQGAPAAQGDAFMTKYATRTSSLNPTYCPTFGYCADDPEGYYNYGIEIPAGGNGEVHIFDPGFCDVSGQRGTGEFFTTDSTNGNGSDTRPVSAYYRLYNTNGTPYDFTDDVLMPQMWSDSTFRRGYNQDGRKYYDDVLRQGSEPSGSGYTDCSTASWHNEWVQLAAGLPPGTYRLHTTSHDASAPNDQDDTTALNAFAIWARAASGINDVRVFGLGAMEAYFPLPAGETSQFYLAQIEAIHAGKWVDISLWDPGDTGTLRADLRILIPTASGYSAIPFHYNSISGTTMPSSFTCGPSTSAEVSSIRTNTSGDRPYNGKWLRLCVQIPDDYTAPTPPADALTPPGGQEPGWWRISYDMGPGSNPSTDLTTWKVDIRGNPVHLIIPEEDEATP